MSKKDKNSLSSIARMIAANDRKVASAKIERKETQCNCMHKKRSGKLSLRPHKKGKTWFKCRECKDKVDFSVMTNGTEDEIRDRIKEICDNFYNLCNIAKITIHPKYDGKYGKKLSKAQFMAYQVKRYAKIALLQNFEPDKKGKKGKKNKNGGSKFTLGGGGMSFRH